MSVNGSLGRFNITLRYDLNNNCILEHVSFWYKIGEGFLAISASGLLNQL